MEELGYKVIHRDRVETPGQKGAGANYHGVETEAVLVCVCAREETDELGVDQAEGEALQPLSADEAPRPIGVPSSCRPLSGWLWSRHGVFPNGRGA
jgi:hypothetical protein